VANVIASAPERGRPIPGASAALWRGSTEQRLRLVSGLILFSFVLGHFLNHAMGLVSLEAMTAVDEWRTAIDDSIPGTIVLSGAVVTHVGLALWKLARMRSWRLPPWHLAQIALGFTIPLLVLPHLIKTRIAWAVFGIDTTYPQMLVRIWPRTIVVQTALLIIVWLHACIGLHFWLRLASWYDRLRPFFLAGAVLLPFAALAGVMMQARALEGTLIRPETIDAYRAPSNPMTPQAASRLEAWGDKATLLFYLPAASAVALIMGALWWRRRFGGVTVTYVEGPVVRGMHGATLLEISRSFGVPHVSVCGGRGRCSTCRVRVIAHSTPLPAPNDAEARTLKAVGAAADVRLACQWRPAGEVRVLRLVKPIESGGATSEPAREAEGVDAEAAVLFVDIRGFTALSEKKLAYDIVHILNRFFEAANMAVHEAGGRIEKYIGDGFMALFDDPRGVAVSSQAAVAAAGAIDAALASVNRELAAELHEPLRLAMGLHAGRLVIGRIGAGNAAEMTVIGAVVNVASRLEALAKTRDAQLALSRITADWAGLDTVSLGVEEAEVRGLDRAVTVVLVKRLADLSPIRASASVGS
jgi:adenylate cyclase